jgi:uncharacterized protein (TIGR03663 family)
MSAPTTRAEAAPRFGWSRWDWHKTLRDVRSALATREALAYAALVGAALALRLFDLSSRAFHHDESQHGYFSWLFSAGHGYHYDPILHGPLRDLVTGSLFFLFGDGDGTARLGSALFGSLLVALPFLLRRQLGRTASFTAAVLFCVSPAYLYYSRFEREDIYVAALTLALTVAVFRFLDRPRPWHPSVILGLLAASFATKETTYITVFVAGTFFLAVAALEWRDVRAGRVSLRETRLLGPVVRVGRDAWISGGAVFLAVFTLLFTTFFTNPAGLGDGLVDSIRYWLSQQPVGRGGQPPYYYFVLLPAYELPALVLGVVGAVVALRRRSLLGLYLVWAAVLNLGLYAWTSEKMPWLVLHPLLPIILLAGIGVQSLWQNRSRLGAKIVLAVAALTAVPMLWGSLSLNYRHPADPEELLVYVQTSQDVTHVRDVLVGLDGRVRAATGRPLQLQIDQHFSMDWPWYWYLRHLQGAAAARMDDARYVPPEGAQALLVSADNRPHLLPRLRGYRGFRFRHRQWWTPDYGGATVGGVLRWLVYREPWNPSGRGGLDEWLYIRKGLPSAAARPKR